MNKNKTELVFILDRSGSMSGLESDTIGGFNATLKKQKDETGEAIVTTILFDDKVEMLHDRTDITAIDPMTDKDYYVRGSTALLDAVGRTIGKIGNAHKNTKEEHRPGHVMIVITTDGFENASREYSYGQISSMVKHQKEKYGWEFIFLGANIDAVATAASMGISKERAANYNADSEGTKLNYESLNKVVSSMRNNSPILADWKADIEADYVKRKK
jgi:uncharacterized protein YegL